MAEEELVIRVNNLSKEYAIKSDSSFFALKNVSFDVRKGDVISIIGNNGSGKTTLLKILSNVTKPSSGEVLTNGTSSSILDIGGNFHPDLTGRQNVQLQLKLAGKSKSELEKYSAEILDFSEIGAFFDQPVKHYSSGMFLRLAFSMAFHLASDILILDEVLSVGDEGFRLKCQELLKQFAEKGKTIVFVSHNRQEILELGNKCIWLERGEIKKIGLPTDLLGEYFAGHLDKHERKKKVVDTSNTANAASGEGMVHITWTEEEAPKDDAISIRAVIVTSALNKEHLYGSDPIHLEFVLNKRIKGAKIGVFFFLQDVFYQPVMVGHMLHNHQEKDLSIPTGDHEGLMHVTCTIPGDFLIPGKYYLQLRFGMEEYDWNPRSKELFRFLEKLSFTIYPNPSQADIIRDGSKGSFRPRLDWSVSLE
jgi:lipopolysaccharide transport system ATP-binding protein